MVNECKIVEDLLPLYAEELTNEESAEFIRNHTAHCTRCATLMDRAAQPVRDLPDDPETMKMALRKDRQKMIARSIKIAAVVVSGIYLFFGFIFWYMAWEDGEFGPEGQFVAERESTQYQVKSTHYQVNVYDWNTAGFFRTGEGSIIRESCTILTEDEEGPGSSGSTSSFFAPWENVWVDWAPNGEDYLFTVELTEGGTGHFLRLNDFWIEEGNGSFGKHELIPRNYTGGGLAEILVPLCREHPEILGDWTEIEFTFHRWGEDSETLSFVYETDTGIRGFLDYHYPTETITKVE